MQQDSLRIDLRRAVARGKLGPTPELRRLAAARPPQPRESGSARHPNTGPGAEGGGGWPMHATAQPWHAEGRPSTTGALRRLLSPRGPREEPGRYPLSTGQPRGCSFKGVVHDIVATPFAVSGQVGLNAVTHGCCCNLRRQLTDHVSTMGVSVTG